MPRSHLIECFPPGEEPQGPGRGCRPLHTVSPAAGPQAFLPVAAGGSTKGGRTSKYESPYTGPTIHEFVFQRDGHGEPRRSASPIKDEVIIDE